MAEKVSLKDIDKLGRDMEKKGDEKEDLFKSMSSKYISKNQPKEEEAHEQPASTGNVFDDLFTSTAEPAQAIQEPPVVEEAPYVEKDYEKAETEPRMVHLEDEPEVPQESMFSDHIPEPQPIRRQAAVPVPGGSRRYELTYEVGQKGRAASGYVGVSVIDKGKDCLYVGNLPVFQELKNFPIVTRQHTSGDRPFGFKVTSEIKQNVALPVVVFDYPEDKDSFAATVVGIIGGRPVWQVRYGISQSGAAKHESVVYPDSTIKVKNVLTIVSDTDGKLIVAES